MPRTLNLTHAECIMLIRAVRRCAAHEHGEHAKVADALYDRLVELDTKGGLTLSEPSPAQAEAQPETGERLLDTCSECAGSGGYDGSCFTCGGTGMVEEP